MKFCGGAQSGRWTGHASYECLRRSKTRVGRANPVVELSLRVCRVGWWACRRTAVTPCRCALGVRRHGVDLAPRGHSRSAWARSTDGTEWGCTAPRGRTALPTACGHLRYAPVRAWRPRVPVYPATGRELGRGRVGVRAAWQARGPQRRRGRRTVSVGSRPLARSIRRRQRRDRKHGGWSTQLRVIARARAIVDGQYSLRLRGGGVA